MIEVSFFFFSVAYFLMFAMKIKYENILIENMKEWIKLLFFSVFFSNPINL